MHWTQKPENREKLIRVRRLAAAARVAKRKGSPRARRAPVRGTVQLHLNGHALTPAIPIGGKKLAKAAVMQLALDGARARLAQLEKEADVLRIFLKAGAAEP